MFDQAAQYKRQRNHYPCVTSGPMQMHGTNASLQNLYQCLNDVRVTKLTESTEYSHPKLVTSKTIPRGIIDCRLRLGTFIRFWSHNKRDCFCDCIVRYQLDWKRQYEMEDTDVVYCKTCTNGFTYERHRHFSAAQDLQLSAAV